MEQIKNILLEKLEEMDNLVVLDLSCGNGEGLTELAKEKEICRYTGIASSDKLIDDLYEQSNRGKFNDVPVLGMKFDVDEIRSIDAFELVMILDGSLSSVKDLDKFFIALNKPLIKGKQVFFFTYQKGKISKNKIKKAIEKNVHFSSKPEFDLIGKTGIVSFFRNYKAE